MGSSPLTQGKLLVAVRACDHDGLIPAHAGKTFGDDDARRGEPGSSPLTRGKPDQGTNPLSPGGLIPAHAGKTIS